MLRILAFFDSENRKSTLPGGKVLLYGVQITVHNVFLKGVFVRLT